GQFDTFTDYLWYQEKHTVGVGNFARLQAILRLVGGVFEEEQDKASSNFSVSIDQMRQQISRNNASWVSLEMSTWWFDNMTVFIDIMFQVQLRLAERILTNLERSLTSDNKQIAIGIGLFCLSLIIAHHSAYSASAASFRMCKNYAFNLSNQTKTVKSRTTSKLKPYCTSLLPKSIRDQLKRGSQVYQNATGVNDTPQSWPTMALDLIHHVTHLWRFLTAARASAYDGLRALGLQQRTPALLEL
uniref:NIT domain-containing protein n=1 Tax=Macrostomum lignano TaxID=282301 RepID=A0A1I8F8R5_9PLAT